MNKYKVVGSRLVKHSRNCEHKQYKYTGVTNSFLLYIDGVRGRAIYISVFERTWSSQTA